MHFRLFDLFEVKRYFWILSLKNKRNSLKKPTSCCSLLQLMEGGVLRWFVDNDKSFRMKSPSEEPVAFEQVALPIVVYLASVFVSIAMLCLECLCFKRTSFLIRKRWQTRLDNYTMRLHRRWWLQNLILILILISISISELSTLQFFAKGRNSNWCLEFVLIFLVCY